MVFDKLTVIQNALKVPKAQFNKFGNFYYRSVEDIFEAIKPLLKNHGVSLTISDEVFVCGEHVLVKATATLKDIEDGSECSASANAGIPFGKKGMDESQVVGSASSYARKYALNGLFLLDDSKDSDSLEKEIASGKPDPVMIKSLRDKTGGDKSFEEFLVSVQLQGGEKFKSFDDLNIGQVEYLIRNWDKLLAGTAYEDKK